MMTNKFMSKKAVKTNRAIAVFSGQKSGTKIILSSLQSFLLFLKARVIDILPEITPKTISHGNEKN